MAKSPKNIEAAAETVNEAPAAAAPATDTTAADTKKSRAVAKREWLNASGTVVENEEEATGVRYTELETGESVDWQSGGDAGQTATMVACFGMLTLMGNIRNTIKNGNEPSDENVVDAIRARIAVMDGGKWLDRASGAGGPKIDVAKMAAAFIEWVQTTGSDEAKGKLQTQEVYAERLETDKSYAAKVRNIPEVKIIYNRLAGKAVDAGSLV